MMEFAVYSRPFAYLLMLLAVAALLGLLLFVYLSV